jgi:G3E family GTPase
VISLPNGCVCCTVGAGLHEALDALASSPSPPDHVVIEVSGVADPSVAAGWGTVAPFEPAGVIVLADATSIIERSRDRYVGDEVRRQIAGADLVVITKVDLCQEPELAEVERWIGVTSGGAPSIRVVDGEISTGVILGAHPGRATSSTSGTAHGAHYVSWSWISEEMVPRSVLDELLSSLPPEVLRVKGWVHLDDGTWVDVQIVGRRVEVTPRPPVDRTALVAIAVRSDPPVANPFAAQFGRPAPPAP